MESLQAQLEEQRAEFTQKVVTLTSELKREQHKSAQKAEDHQAALQLQQAVVDHLNTQLAQAQGKPQSLQEKQERHELQEKLREQAAQSDQMSAQLTQMELFLLEAEEGKQQLAANLVHQVLGSKVSFRVCSCLWSLDYGPGSPAGGIP